MNYRFGRPATCDRGAVVCQHCNKPVAKGHKQRFEFENKRWWCLNCADEMEMELANQPEEKTASTRIETVSNAGNVRTSTSNAEDLRIIANAINALTSEVRQLRMFFQKQEPEQEQEEFAPPVEAPKKTGIDAVWEKIEREKKERDKRIIEEYWADPANQARHKNVTPFTPRTAENS